MEVDRISRSTDVMGGKPCVRGTRVTVGIIVGLIATGSSRSEVLEAYPYLEEQEVSRYAGVPAVPVHDRVDGDQVTKVCGSAPMFFSDRRYVPAQRHTSPTMAEWSW